MEDLTGIMQFRRVLVTLILLTAPLGVGAEPARSALLANAESFMRSYATELQAGNARAILQRYDARGAYFVGQGEKRFLTFEQIGKMYQESWQPPTSFAWTEISYEEIAHDAIVVIGGFDWGISPAAVTHFSYSALLLRFKGGLKIRLEDESPAPPSRASSGLK